MGISDFEETGEAAAIARDWGVNVKLLDDIAGQWELLDNTTDDGLNTGYYVQFDSDVAPDILDALGVDRTLLFREVSLNAFDQPEPEDPDEPVRYLANRYKALGGRFGAIQIGTEYVLNPWHPDTEEAANFWREHIVEMPVKDRKAFLRILASYGW